MHPHNQSLSEFAHQSPEFMQQLKLSGKPLVLSVDGKPELVVQDAGAYQKLLDQLEEAQTLEGIRHGLEDMKAGRTISFDEFKDYVRQKHGIPL